MTNGASSAAEKTQSLKAIIGLLNNVGGQNHSKYAYGAIRGAIYELHDFVSNSLPKKVMNGRQSKGDDIEQVTDSVGRRMIGGAEKDVAREAMLFGQGVTDATKKRKANQFKRYKANAEEGVIDVVEYAFPDAASKQRFIDFLVKKKPIKSADPSGWPSWLKIEINPMS